MKTFCFLVVVLLKGCKPLDGMQHFFKINNNSNYLISYYVGESYPDTLITQTKPLLNTILPNSNSKHARWGTWEKRFSQIEKLSVFIFHTDTLNKYTWTEVRDGYKILKRYDLSLEDLEGLKFKVSYPPTQEMQNMSQYPPYEKPSH